jgi:hypothetical protein
MALAGYIIKLNGYSQYHGFNQAVDFIEGDFSRQNGS